MVELSPIVCFQAYTWFPTSPHPHLRSFAQTLGTTKEGALGKLARRVRFAFATKAMVPPLRSGLYAQCTTLLVHGKAGSELRAMYFAGGNRRRGITPSASRYQATDVVDPQVPRNAHLPGHVNHGRLVLWPQILTENTLYVPSCGGAVSLSYPLASKRRSGKETSTRRARTFEIS